MTIEFKCPRCRQMLYAPDEAAGKRAKCGLCGLVVPVPGIAPAQAHQETDEISLVPDESRVPSQRPARQLPALNKPAQAIQKPSASSAQSSGQPNNSQANPGWQYLDAPQPAPYGQSMPEIQRPMSFAAQPGSTISRYFEQCITAPVYAFKALGSCMVLLIILAVCLLAQMGINMGLGFAATSMGPGSATFIGIVALIVAVCMWMLMNGYVWRYQLDVINASARGDDNPPAVPSFDAAANFKAAFNYITIIVVYSLPLITLPLLPLGMLAAGYTGDGRCLNLAWALRAAIKRPGHLLLAWASIAVLGILMVAGMVIMAMVMAAFASDQSTAKRLFVIFLGSLAIMLMILGFSCFVSRCAGSLGSSCPDILESLPSEPNPVYSIASFFGAAGLALLVYSGLWGFVVPAISQQASVFRDRFTPKQGASSPQPDLNEPPRSIVSSDDKPSDVPPPAIQERRSHETIDRGEQSPEIVARQKSLEARRNMQALDRALRRYRSMHSRKLPDTLAELKAGLPAEQPSTFHSPDDPAKEYRYIAIGQSGAAFDHIIAVDTSDINGRHVVLRYGGGIDEIASGNLESTLASQLAQRQQAQKSPERLAWASEAPKPSPTATTAEAPGLFESGRARAGTKDKMPVGDIQGVAVWPKYDLSDARDELTRAKYHLYNLRAALWEYAAKHQGNFPADLQELVDGGLLSYSDIRSPNFARPYLYYKGQMVTKPTTAVLVADGEPIRRSNPPQFLYLAANGSIISLSGKEELDKEIKKSFGENAVVPESPVSARTTLRPSREAREAQDQGNVEWPVGTWSQDQVAPDNPMRDVCMYVTQMIVDTRYQATAGVNFGPPAQAKTDQAYVDFKKQTEETFTRVFQERPGVAPKSGKQTLANVEYDKMWVPRDYTTAVVLITIRDGRCVSYWMNGSNNCFISFSQNLDKAKLKK